MRNIKVYRPPGEVAPVIQFLNSLEPRLAEKIIFQIYRAATLHPSEMKEPHIKHFVLERYREFYEICQRRYDFADIRRLKNAGKQR